MDVETAIRTRRTHKAFTDEPLSRTELAELLELANWAPNHNLTVPWRFRVVGPATLAGLKEAAGPEGAAKLDRCPTPVAVSCRLSGEPVQDEEDLHATAVAEAGRAALGLPPEERSVGLLHLGHRRQERPVPERPAADTTVFLD